jgi:predicted NACHT family NTPase
LPSVVQPLAQDTNFQLQENLLEFTHGSILITGSAGHGKTSFCQHYAALDAKTLTSNKSDVLPVYIKLHHLASWQLGTFDEEFFSTTELRSLAGKASNTTNARIKRIRLYLDGLDEVPRVDRQQELMELAKSAVDSDSRIEVIVTSRNYVNGPWLNWMPRVAITELDQVQISDLVGGLLGNNASEVEQFTRELKKVPSLEPLMKVPLLATLIVSVYKKRTALPENRVRLYETFLNLMCGGWDLAKNVRRRTDFGSVGKLSVLTRLAGHMHLNRERECNEQSIRIAVKTSNPAFVSQCRELAEELLQDGALTRSGTAYAFCHLSFQEYLAAKELNDPSGRRQQNILRWYFRGDDWWYQMLSFYIGTLGKPEDTEHWLATSYADAEASGVVADDAHDRCRRLMECIVESAPGYWPKFTNPSSDSDLAEPAAPVSRRKKKTDD